MILSVFKPISYKPKVTPAQIKRAKVHAQNLCFNYEDTEECKNAWDVVRDLEIEYKLQEQKKTVDPSA